MLTDKLYPSRITFVVEQDGSPERALKAKLITRFQADSNLECAYLVRVRCGNSPELKVTLCLSATEPSPHLVEAVGREFKQMFGSDESLDIMFLSPKQREEVSRIAN